MEFKNKIDCKFFPQEKKQKFTFEFSRIGIRAVIRKNNSRLLFSKVDCCFESPTITAASGTINSRLLKYMAVKDCCVGDKSMGIKNFEEIRRYIFLKKTF